MAGSDYYSCDVMPHMVGDCTPNYRVAFANRLKGLRVDAGMTQAQLSKKSGLQQAHVSHFETRTQLPSVTSLSKLCKALSLTGDQIKWLLAALERRRCAGEQAVAAKPSPPTRKEVTDG